MAIELRKLLRENLPADRVHPKRLPERVHPHGVRQLRLPDAGTDYLNLSLLWSTNDFIFLSL